MLNLDDSPTKTEKERAKPSKDFRSDWAAGVPAVVPGMIPSLRGADEQAKDNVGPGVGSGSQKHGRIGIPQRPP